MPVVFILFYRDWMKSFTAQRQTNNVRQICRLMSSVKDEGSSVLIFGSSTGVGKTIVSAGLSRAALHATRKVCYIKPVQTGDMDQYFVKFYTNPEGVRDIHFRTLRHWIAGYNGPADQSIGPDKDIVDDILREIDTFESTLPLAEGASSRTSGTAPFCVVETAGGVLSPGPNQSLQADMYRPLQQRKHGTKEGENMRKARGGLPVVLVGDSGLGGISGTLCALEALQRRGYSVRALVFVDKPCSDKLQNTSHVQHQLVNGFLSTASCAQLSSDSGAVSSLLSPAVPAIINLTPLPQNSQQLLFDWFKLNGEGFAALFRAMQPTESNVRK